MSNPQKLTCDEILQTLFQYLDHELPSDQQYLTYQFHFQDCVPCNEIMIHESQVLTILKDLLQGSCNERAPQDLHDRIREQTQTLAGQNQVGYFSSSTTITNFTFDGATSIQVTQEFTHEIRHDFTEGQ
jgi:mycothiol system anti-sigma-R factor